MAPGQTTIKVQAPRPTFEHGAKRLQLRSSVGSHTAAQHRHHQFVRRVGKLISKALAQIRSGRGNTAQDRPDMLNRQVPGRGFIQFLKRFARDQNLLENPLALKTDTIVLPGLPQAAPDPDGGKLFFKNRPIDGIEHIAAVKNQPVAQLHQLAKPQVVHQIIGEFVSVVRAFLDQRGAGKTSLPDQWHTAWKGRKGAVLRCVHRGRDQRAALRMAKTDTVGGNENRARMVCNGGHIRWRGRTRPSASSRRCSECRSSHEAFAHEPADFRQIAKNCLGQKTRQCCQMIRPLQGRARQSPPAWSPPCSRSPALLPRTPPSAGWQYVHPQALRRKQPPDRPALQSWRGQGRYA